MQKIPGLFAKNMPAIEKDTWYRQRFDACPHFMFFLGDAHVVDIQTSAYPFGQRIAYAGFSKNRADWYHSLTELRRTAEGVIGAAEQDETVSKKMVAEFLPWQEKFYAACEELDRTSVSNLSNEELLQKYNNLAAIYTKKLNPSPLIDGFALSTDTVIASELRTFLEQKGLADTFTEHFHTLTAPTFTSFLQEEEIALRQIAEIVQKAPEKTAELITAHQKQYFWMQNNYTNDRVLTESEFSTRLQEMLKEDNAAEISRLRQLAIDHKTKKDELIAELNLPQRLRNLLTITDDFNAWQDERKKGTFWATHYFSLLLEEFAKRTEYTMDELKYAFPPEMGDVLTKALSREKLQQRYNYCMLLWTTEGYEVSTDQKLIETLDAIGTGHAQRGNQVKGFAAQLGIAKGKVVIVESVQEMGKVQEGDVLVSVMTRPDYLPAMKKAIAFVTDEGGITCHAAIVAREMKKPCVIGTKIATKTFKDGDIVEVNANTGIVSLVI